MAVISSGTANQLRRVFNSLLSHTYTRVTPGAAVPTTAADTEYDDWGTPERAADTEVTGVACQYSDNQRVRVAGGGWVLVEQPSIKVAHDDPVTVGCTVKDIHDADGTVLLAGPLKVVSVVPLAGLGPTIQKRAFLSGGETEAG